MDEAANPGGNRICINVKQNGRCSGELRDVVVKYSRTPVLVTATRLIYNDSGSSTALIETIDLKFTSSIVRATDCASFVIEMALL